MQNTDHIPNLKKPIYDLNIGNYIQKNTKKIPKAIRVLKKRKMKMKMGKAR
jgi:hypothetical protein